QWKFLVSSARAKDESARRELNAREEQRMRMGAFMRKHLLTVRVRRQRYAKVSEICCKGQQAKPTTEARRKPKILPLILGTPGQVNADNTDLRRMGKPRHLPQRAQRSQRMGGKARRHGETETLPRISADQRGSAAQLYSPERANSTARTNAWVLLMHSWYSLSGTESATMPAPAWT